MKRITFAATLTVLSLAGFSPALAHGDKGCTTEPQDKWKPLSEAEAAAKQAGYEVKKSQIEGSCIEVYGVDKDGRLFELYYDPIDLMLVKTEEK